MFQVGLPTAELDCDLGEYVELICGMFVQLIKNFTARTVIVPCMIL
jgi:hypothetical protein